MVPATAKKFVPAVAALAEAAAGYHAWSRLRGEKASAGFASGDGPITPGSPR